MSGAGSRKQGAKTGVKLSYVAVFAQFPILLTLLVYIHVGNAAIGKKSASKNRICGRANNNQNLVDSSDLLVFGAKDFICMFL